MIEVGKDCDKFCCSNFPGTVGDGTCYELCQGGEPVAMLHWKVTAYLVRYSDGEVFQVPPTGELKVKLP